MAKDSFGFDEGSSDEDENEEGTPIRPEAPFNRGRIDPCELASQHAIM